MANAWSCRVKVKQCSTALVTPTSPSGPKFTSLRSPSDHPSALPGHHSLRRCVAKVFHDAGEGVWMHLYCPGEWIVDGDDDQQPREDQNRQRAGHRRLGAEIFGAKKEG